MSFCRRVGDVDHLGFDFCVADFRVGAAFEQRRCGIGLLAASRFALHGRHLLAALAEYLQLERVERLLLEALFLGNVIELLLKSKRVLFPLALMIAGRNHPDV